MIEHKIDAVTQVVYKMTDCKMTNSNIEEPVAILCDIGEQEAIPCDSIYITIPAPPRRRESNNDAMEGCAYIFGYAGAIIAEICFIILGILALIPSKPFETRDVTFGVVSLVLSFVGVIAIAGALVGALIGAIIGAVIDRFNL